jgi:hypothetical protein
VGKYSAGNAATSSQASLDIPPDIRAWQCEACFQDNFRVSRNVTLSLGVRYSTFRPPWDEKGFLTNFDPALFDLAKAPVISSANGNIIAGGNPNYDPLNGISINSQASPYGTKATNEVNTNFAPGLALPGIRLAPRRKNFPSYRLRDFCRFDPFGVYEQNIFNNAPYVQSVTISNTRLENPTGGSPVVTLAPEALRGIPAPVQTPAVELRHTACSDEDVQCRCRPSRVEGYAPIGHSRYQPGSARLRADGGTAYRHPHRVCSRRQSETERAASLSRVRSDQHVTDMVQLELSFAAGQRR